MRSASLLLLSLTLLSACTDERPPRPAPSAPAAPVDEPAGDVDAPLPLISPEENGGELAAPAEERVGELEAEALLAALVARMSSAEDVLVEMERATVTGPTRLPHSATIWWRASGGLRSVIDLEYGGFKQQVLTISDGERALVAKVEVRDGQRRASYAELPPSSPRLRDADPLLFALLEGDLEALARRGLSFRASEHRIDGVPIVRLRGSAEMPQVLSVVSWDFDKAELRLRGARASFEALDGPSSKDPTAATLLMTRFESTVTALRRDEGLSDELFVVTPPEGAERVELEALGLGGGLAIDAPPSKEE